ncbi:MAG: class II aldolase/adducin family protein [Archaeoglobaceae archaeon]
MIKEAIEIGKLLFRSRLIDGASGNISFRENGRIMITKTGSNLESLEEFDFVPIESPNASRDKAVHLKIYELSEFNAVLHCHGVFNVVLSLKKDEITPLDLEGKLYFGKIEVVKEEFGKEGYAKEIAEKIRRNGVVIARGHGIYSAGKSLREAFNKACYVEHSCEILYYSEILDKLEHRKSRKEL